MDKDIINKILGITESYQAPQAMMDRLMDKESKDKTFKEFLKHETNMNYEWFRKYFEEEHSDRKVKKQDFTPRAISEMVAKMTGTGDFYYEVAAGTGSMLIQAWKEQCRVEGIFKYDPRAHWFQVEELSDRAIPFLIFNMAIRGMNGVALHGDSLTREFKEAYFIRNDTDDYLGFSEIIKMPHTKELEKFLDIRKWRS